MINWDALKSIELMIKEKSNQGECESERDRTDWECGGDRRLVEER